MATPTVIALSDDGAGGLREPLDRAVARMVSVDTLNGRWRVGMPVATLSGSLIDVSVWPEGDGDTFMVSDDGVAWREAQDAMASPRTFRSIARHAADKAGAVFDGHAMFFLRTDAARLQGAIIAMAGLTREVIDRTLEKAAHEKAQNDHDLLLARLGDAFPGRGLAEDATVLGRSGAEYKVDALVEIGDRGLAFDHFTSAGASVNAAFVTLSDIARLEDGPMPIGVTPSLEAVGRKLTLISSVARVIPTSAPAENYALLAA